MSMMRQLFRRLATLIICWQLFFPSQLVNSVLVREHTPLEADIPPEGVQYCIDLSPDGSACDANPMKIRRKVDSPSVIGNKLNLGVKQRIDGTPEEQKAIKDIIQLMNTYWLEEVLSNHDYESVRTDCKNYNELCAFWATIGECEKESGRAFMLKQCAAACRLCLLKGLGLGPPLQESSN